MLKDVKLPVKSRFPEARIIATNRGWAYDNRTPFPIVLNPKQMGLKNKLVAAGAPTTLVEYKQFIADNPKVLKGPGLQSAPTPPAVENTPPTIGTVQNSDGLPTTPPVEEKVADNATEREGAEGHLDDMAKYLLQMQKEEEEKKAAEAPKEVKKPKKVKKPKAKN